MASAKSFKKILQGMENLDKKEDRRVKRTPSRRSSGYIHDIAFKKDLEGQIRSNFVRN
jgi:hypothetical protein